MDVAKQSEWLTLESAEQAYRHLTAYRFAQQYVEGKSVADISRSNLGYGSRLLAGTAEAVVGLTDSVPDFQTARALHPAPNIHYGTSDFYQLPYPENHFDVLVAFEVIEDLQRPEEFVEEAERVLKEEGTFVISTPDKQASRQRNRKNAGRYELYVPELRELLERRFKQVEILRCGAVAGGLIHADPEEASEMLVESASFSLTSPSFGSTLPELDFALAVCSNSASREIKDEGSYLLLDEGRRLLEENDDSLEDVELLRDEIRFMEQTEVRAFGDILEVRQAEIALLKKELEISQQHLANIEQSNAWRLIKVYRRLRGV